MWRIWAKPTLHQRRLASVPARVLGTASWNAELRRARDRAPPRDRPVLHGHCMRRAPAAAARSALAARSMRARDRAGRQLRLAQAKRAPGRRFRASDASSFVVAKMHVVGRDGVGLAREGSAGRAHSTLVTEEVAEVVLSGSGVSMAGKCPPRSDSDQCAMVPSGSVTLLIVVSAANPATRFGGPVCWSAARAVACGWEAAIRRRVCMPSQVLLADEAPDLGSRSAAARARRSNCSSQFLASCLR
jgi:hypothetical protein